MPGVSIGSGCKVISGVNQHAELVSAVQGMLVSAESARLAVGYFFVEGLSPLIEPLGKLERIDLLIGNVVNRLTEEQMRELGHSPGAVEASSLSDSEFAARYRAERDQSAAETALNLRRTIESLPRVESVRDTILALAQWIAQGALARSRLHALAAARESGIGELPGGARPSSWPRDCRLKQHHPRRSRVTKRCGHVEPRSFAGRRGKLPNFEPLVRAALERRARFPPRAFSRAWAFLAAFRAVG